MGDIFFYLLKKSMPKNVGQLFIQIQKSEHFCFFFELTLYSPSQSCERVQYGTNLKQKKNVSVSFSTSVIDSKMTSHDSICSIFFVVYSFLNVRILMENR